MADEEKVVLKPDFLRKYLADLSLTNDRTTMQYVSLRLGTRRIDSLNNSLLEFKTIQNLDLSGNNIVDINLIQNLD